MGGGMSNSSGLEEMINATHMVGRAIAAITFPGMFRIYDFHSLRAPRLKSMSSFFMFNQEQDDDDDEEFDDNQFTAEELEKIFYVQVGNDKIYLEDPTYENESGWTALHTCCMSFLTVPAGLKLIDYISEKDGNFDTKTLIGPGTFNKGWTALHMASAYGIEPLVVKLLEAGANPNTTNCYGYTPLLEATHRGFMTIASILVKHGARMDYIPPEDLSRASPFVSTPAQSPLGEAARCGYSRIVQDLLDKGAPKNLGNSLGWTPLHEACFYNRIETVKVLLLSGADSSIRSQSGALPFHLAGLQTIRDMIRDMGCNGSLPRNERDAIDMMTILQELTYSSSERNESSKSDRHRISNNNNNNNSILSDESRVVKEHSRNKEEKDQDGNEDNDDDDNDDNDPDAKHLTDSSSKRSKQRNKESKHSSNTSISTSTSTSSSEPQLLHSGPLLGNLPLLQSNPNPSPTKQKNVATPSPKSKKKRNTPSAIKESNLPKDLPKEFICELCQRQMIDPVKSIYGNVFERGVIEEWLKNQGKICPITGAPLSEADLTPNEDLKIKIRKWILQKSISPDDSPLVPDSETTSASPTNSQLKNKNSPTKGTNNKTKVGNSSVEDDLYDF